MGVDGVPSMNVEEDRDNERKLREEQLIASMEDQLYKIHSAESSPSSNQQSSLMPDSQKQSSPSSNSRYSIQEAQYAPATASSSNSPKSLLPSSSLMSMSASSRRRSESLPPPLRRGGGRTEPLSPHMLYPYTPEPSKTYSEEHSVLRSSGMKDGFPFKTSFSGSCDYQGQNDTTLPNSINKPQPYSSSLENLDPSAKEFMVDAGVILDNVSPSPITITRASDFSNIPSATSLPNLSKIGKPPPAAGASIPISPLKSLSAKPGNSPSHLDSYQSDDRHKYDNFQVMSSDW